MFRKRQDPRPAPARRWLAAPPLVALLAGLTGLMIAVGVVAAAPPAASLSVSPSRGTPGETLTVSGANFRKSTSVVLTWDGDTAGLPAPVMRPNGSFTVAIVIPPTSDGGHVLEARSGSTSARTTVQVDATAPAPGTTPTPTPTATMPPANATTTTTVPPSPTRSPAATPTLAPSPSPTAAAPGDFAAEERQLVDLINGSRVAAGVGPVAIDQRVMDVARWRAEDMNARQYSSHVIPAGACYRGTCWNRDIYVWDVLTAAGVPWRWAGENLWLGGGPDDQMAEAANSVFLGSPSHRANMLDAQWTHVGTGMAHYVWTNGTHVVEVFVRLS
ncbi:MAG: hypothetical protein HY332_09445 [Chloroflexi bacterium]|nr:hypothetical protein [Chloroflexota bacterium]